jgi:hypothetical protein
MHVHRRRHWFAAFAAMASVACGQWSGAPVPAARDAAVPLGPGPVVRIASGPPLVGSPQLRTHGRTAAIAWVVDGGDDASVFVSISRDAGATFDPPLTLGVVPLGADDVRLELGLSAPDRSAGRIGESRVWVRAERSGTVRLAWQSTDAGRTFEATSHSDVPATVSSEPWGVQRMDPRRFSLIPPAALRAAGPKSATYPRSATPGSAPAVVVDDHGALALAWKESAGDAQTVVLRRVWFDWNVPGGDVTPFDAPLLVADRVSQVTPVALASVPGGVVVAWAADEADRRTSLFGRRIGLDMTCTLEQTVGGSRESSVFKKGY